MNAAPRQGGDASRNTPWTQAHTLARTLATPLPGRPAPVVTAGGQVLAEEITCVRAVPAFDNAAMDGYAVAGPGPWTVTGLILAGAPVDVPTLRSGEAVEIATGAPVPVGTEAVLPYEDAHLDAAGSINDAPGSVHDVPGSVHDVPGSVHDVPDGFRGSPAPGGVHGAPARIGWTVRGRIGGRTHIRRAGETLAVGATVAPAGRIVTATLVAAALQAGVEEVVTRRPPTVTLLVTGDEVVSAGMPGPGQVRDTFTGLVTAVTERAGGRLEARHHQPDDPVSLAAALDRAGTDVIVVSGSSSAGAADHLRTLLSERKATWHVRGVACRPGHPQALAELPGGRWVVSLPGNPFAGLVAALTLLEPLLGALAGRSAGPLPAVPVTGSTKLMPGGVRIVPVICEPLATGVPPMPGEGPVPGAAVPAARIGADGGPAGLHAAALADALAVLPDTWASGDLATLLTIP
ncbi:molybdopterin molybdotransferase MoeA [Actinoplanes sp. DH11]|uniref:molybdopterin molybdotransferase MoeA n=1 Tax=Actinoplanes sp. DH11 TaxID=2857011 RepID=UPI001E500FBF|nr:molybdopterin molybdotransferase MoeA [Actinoplanes sp. DH11]